MKQYGVFKNAPVYAIVFIMAAVMAFKFSVTAWQKKVIEHDVISYYAYLPAVVIHHDIALRFADENPTEYQSHFWPVKTAEGNNVIKTTMGMAFLYAPFFMAAHLYETAAGLDAQGFSASYHAALSFAALAYLLLGLIFLRKILLQWFSPLSTALTLLLVVFATNLFHYVSREPGMSHTYSFGLIALFVWLNMQWLKNPRTGHSIMLGALAGLIVLIRPTNGLVLLFPLLWNVSNRHDAVQRLVFFRKNVTKIVLAAFAAFVIWIPQLLYWKMQTGQYFFNSYNEHFYFSNFHVFDALFGYRKGWFVYTPVMLIAVAAIFFMHRSIRKIQLLYVLFVTVFVYVTFSWWCWWYGGGYSARPMIDIYAIMALPLATVVHRGVNAGKWLRWLTLIFVLMFVAHGYFQTIQYKNGAIHYDSNTKQSYWDSFLRSKPSSVFYFLLQQPDYENAILGNDEEFDENVEEVVKMPGDFYDSISHLKNNKNQEYLNILLLGVHDTFSSYQGQIIIPKNDLNDFGDHLLIQVAFYRTDECIGFTSLNLSEMESYPEDIIWKFSLNVPVEKIDGDVLKVFLWSVDKKSCYIEELRIVISNVNDKVERLD